MPRRSDAHRPRRVVLHGAGEDARRSPGSVCGPSTKSMIALAFSLVDARRDVDEQQPADELGVARRRAAMRRSSRPSTCRPRARVRREPARPPRRRRRPCSAGCSRRRRASRSARGRAGRRPATTGSARAPGSPCPRCGRSARRRGGTRSAGSPSPQISALMRPRPPSTATSARRTLGGPAQLTGRTRRRSRETGRTRRRRCAPSAPSFQVRRTGLQCSGRPGCGGVQQRLGQRHDRGAASAPTMRQRRRALPPPPARRPPRRPPRPPRVRRRAAR